MLETIQATTDLQPGAQFEPLGYADLTDRIYALLREKIFSRSLKPGEILKVGTLADQLQVSRTPVYQALLRLSGENLVTIEPRRTTYVKALSARDVAETYDIRLALELMAAERGVKNFRIEDAIPARSILEQYRRLFETPDFESRRAAGRLANYPQFETLNHQFHCFLIGLAGNAKLLELYKSLNIDVINVRVFYFVPPRHPRDVHPEHERILFAYEAHDLDFVKQALTQHLNANRDATILALQAADGLI